MSRDRKIELAAHAVATFLGTVGLPKPKDWIFFQPAEPEDWKSFLEPEYRPLLKMSARGLEKLL